MDSLQSSADEIKELIQQQHDQGYSLVTFLSDQPILYTDDLNFFNNANEALEFCYENSTDVDYFKCGTSEYIFQLLENQEEQNRINNLKNKEMNQENFDYLKNQVKNAGFGEALDKELMKKMESKEPRFQLKHEQKLPNDEIVSTLNFRKSDKNDNYYFNSYEIAIKADPTDTKKTTPKQTFYIGQNNNFSVDEGYNLLRGRFVNKDLVTPKGEAYNGWAKLNFRSTEPNGNYKMQYYDERWKYNLETALDKYPQIKQLSKELNKGADRANLIAALKKGDRPEITLVQNGVEQKGFVEANPYRWSVYVTDEQNNKVLQPKKEGETQSEKEGQNKEQSQKENKNQKNTPADKTIKKSNKTVKRRTRGVA